MYLLQIPLPNDGWTFAPTFEFRYRIERRNDKDFNPDANDNRTDSCSRLRVGMSGKNKKGESFLVQYQYGIDDYWVKDQRSTVRNSDLQLGYYETPIGDWTLTAGRQNLIVGSGRLISSFSTWGNVGRTFDAVRLRHPKWDLWAMKEGAYNYYNPTARLAGLSYKESHGASTLIFKHDGRDSSAADLWTANQTWKQPFGKATVSAEVDGQAGRRLGKDVRAWAGDINVSRNLDRLTVFGELDLASGGSSGSTSHTFDPLYPNDPAIYGMRQMQGFSNVVEIKVGGCYLANKKDTISFSASDLNLYDAKDAWYGPFGVNKGKSTFQDSTGASGKHIGEMAQLDVQHALSSRELLWGAIGYFAPGSFIKNINGTTKAQTWLFLSYRYKF